MYKSLTVRSGSSKEGDAADEAHPEGRVPTRRSTLSLKRSREEGICGSGHSERSPVSCRARDTVAPVE